VEAGASATAGVERRPVKLASRKARAAIQPTRAGEGQPQEPPRAADEDAHRDDPVVEDVMDTAGLLSERLGAQVIEEIPHD
jgi:hypothetical protein